MQTQLPQSADQNANAIAQCRYCSEVSKASGEDPIGSAPQVDYWLLVEIPQPWPTSIFTENEIIAQIIPRLKRLFFRRGLTIRPVAIAPDKDYSKPDFTRILYYSRPAKQFAHYEKEEYLVPHQNAAGLALALLDRLSGKVNALVPFAAYKQAHTPHREMLVCTHTQVDLACGRFGTPLYRQLRKQYGQPEQQPEQQNHPPLRVWQTTHFGGHQFAPTLIDLPTGQFWGHLSSDVLPQLISRTGNPETMKPFYRGWAGVNRFEQMAEREAWIKVGWDLFTYPRTARIVRKELTGPKKLLYPLLRWVPIKLLKIWLERWTGAARWTEVEVVCSASDRIPNSQSHYRVRIEETSEITSASRSVAKADERIELKVVKQYQCSLLQA
ncbi:MAG: sucrase ferredoxin [Cyanobacteria bacterium J06626_6]